MIFVFTVCSTPTSNITHSTLHQDNTAKIITIIIIMQEAADRIAETQGPIISSLTYGRFFFEPPCSDCRCVIRWRLKYNRKRGSHIRRLQFGDRRFGYPAFLSVTVSPTDNATTIRARWYTEKIAFVLIVFE